MIGPFYCRSARIRTPKTRSGIMITMNDPGSEIPRLERLMRDVLRAVCEQESGANWLAGLSRSVKVAIRNAHEIARKQRPAETLRDSWDAAGLSEIAALLRSEWGALASRLEPAWTRKEEADVDLRRLLDYRGKSLHAVGITNPASQQAEVSGIVSRLRLAFEAIRRSLLPGNTNWIPYMEGIESPIPGLCWLRGHGRPEPPILGEGDLVEIRLVGINPAGPQSDLRYRIEVTGIAAGAIILPPPAGGPYPYQDGNEFTFDVPRTRQILIGCYVSAVGDPDMYDGETVSALVVPRPPHQRN